MKAKITANDDECKTAAEIFGCGLQRAKAIVEKMVSVDRTNKTIVKFLILH